MDEENFPRGGLRLDEITENQGPKKTEELFKDVEEKPNKRVKKGIKNLQKGSIEKGKKFPKPTKLGPLFSVKTKREATEKPWTKKVVPGNRQNFNEKKNNKYTTHDGVTVKPLELLPEYIHTSMKVLGFVKEIQDYSLIMALPNGRRGQVPITNISDAYTKCLESFSNPSGGTDTPNEKLHSLEELFTVGMLLPCTVMQRVPSSPVPLLSINPRVINKSLSVDSLINAQIRYGSICGVEDTGYLVDLGIEEKKGFLRKKNAHNYIEKCNNCQQLKVGQSMWFRILQKSEKKKSANAEKYLSLFLDPELEHLDQVQNKSLKLTELLPGMRVTGKIKKVVDKGLIVSCFKQYAVIHQSHLHAKLSSYTAGDEITCCVLYISPDAKFVTLSALPHIVNYIGKPVHLLGFGSLYIGCLVRDATVLRVKKSKDVVVKLKDNATGVADINSREEDEDYEEGSSHRCVVTELKCKINKAKVSFKEETIREIADPACFVGDIVTGKVERLEERTVVVQVMDKFIGKITLKHQASGLKYTPGTELKCRVLSVSENGRLTLTNRSWALESNYPIVTQPDQVELDQVLQGFVISDRDSYIKVGFLGKAEGIIKKEWVDGREKKQFGDPVTCRVLYFWMNRFVVCLQENVEDFNVPEESVGIVVGKGGSSIKELQKKTSTHIHINGNKCRVCGTKANREKAKEEIMKVVGRQSEIESSSPKLVKKRSLSESSEEASSPKKIKLSPDKESEETMIEEDEFVIPKHEVGKIIGENGSIIKEIRRKTGATVKISSVRENEKSQTCTIGGSHESILNAKDMIHKILNKDKKEKIEMALQRADVGKVIGPKGSIIKEICLKSGAFVKIVNSKTAEGGRKCRILGTVESVQKAKEMIQECIDKNVTNGEQDQLEKNDIKKRDGSDVSKEQQSDPITEYSSPKSGRKRNASENSVESSDSKKSKLSLETQVEIVIPKSAVGKIIGRKGSTIKEMGRKSAATLEILDAESGEEDRKCRIRGSLESITKAKEMINDCIKCKVSDTDRVTQELNIPKECVKKVLGKEGMVVKKIEALSGAKIIMCKKGNQEGRLCKFSGTKQNVMKAKEWIERILSSDKLSDSPEGTQELNIPEVCAQKLIGEGGKIVLMISTLSGANVQVVDGEVEGAGRLCRISGSEENIVKAKELIEGILHENEDSDLPQGTQELNIPEEEVGKVIGKGGKTIKMIEAKSGARVQIIDGEVEGAGRLCRISGPEQKTLKAKGLIEEILSSSKDSDLPQDQQELNIPEEEVGKVIGKGGKTIKMIEAKSGARVQIIDGEVEGAGRLCRISGPEQKILKAKGLIEEILSSSKFQKAEEIIEEFEDDGESDMEQEPDGMVEVRIMVPSSCAQELLQNKKFKQLQTKSQSKISFDEEEEDTDTVCSIKGKEEDVMEAKKKFEKLLKDIEGKKGTEKPTLQLSNSLAWDTEFKLPTTKIESSSDESDSEEVKQRPAKKTKGQIRKEKLEEEKRLYEYERKKLEGEVVPETADDFDRLVINSPDSSVVWLRYMAFHLETSEIDKARTVAERALKTISFREEGEKRNIWLAYLNLENMYGTNESIGKVLARATTQCEPLDIYMPLVHMYIDSSKTEEAERLYSLMVKKYSSRAEVWPKFGEFYFQQGRPDSARKLMQRSLKSLEDRNHVETIIKFAQMEFKYGEPERGKTMFENVLSTYPKRTDIWSVYVDLLTKLKDHAATRALYKRMIGLSLPAKKIKFFFKKYLEFEEKFGTEAQVAEVKQKALEYVESGGTVD